jgi:hypothetical protein
MSASSNRYTSTALETFSLVTGSVKVTSGVILAGFLAENTSGSNGWVQVFDAFAQPASGSVPAISVKVPSQTQISILGCSNIWDHYKQGIVIALSSTGPTYTPVSSALFVTAWWNS